MTYKKGMHPGATWRKCDFQIHTPRDPNWGGPPHLPGGDPGPEFKRSNWADEFVAACKERGLRAIAITDHHDYAFVPYIQAAIDRLPKDDKDILWFFPGVEITCDDSVQCILLFDASTQDEVKRRIFGGSILSKINMASSNDPKLPQAMPCGRNLLDLIAAIASDPFLSPCCIVLPHAGNDNAYKAVIRQGFHARFAQLPSDGFYASGAISTIKQNTLSKIRGEILEWGRRRRGLLLTSDSRDSHFSRLGASNCWIRLGEPTAEALRQALLADEARIVYDEPRLPSQRVLAVSVSSTLCGDDFSMRFNDAFTALIGGRGSGKSAILEYIRFALGRSAIDVSPSEEWGHERERDLVYQTLRGGEVAVTVERDGVIERWVRTLDDADNIRVRLESGEEEQVRVVDAQRRFRARAYYQKQLSTLVNDRGAAADQLTGIAAAEDMDQKRSAEAELAAAQRAITSAVARYEEFCIAKAEYDASQLSSVDIRRRIKATQERLESAGVGEEDRGIIVQAPLYARGKVYLARARDICDNDKSRLSGLQSGILSITIDDFPDVHAFDELACLNSAFEQARGNVRELTGDTIQQIEELATIVQETQRRFDARSGSFEEQHRGAIHRQAAHRALVEDLKKLNQEVNDAEVRERQAEDKLKTLSEAPDGLARARQRLTLALEQRRSILEQAARKVEAMSQGTLRAEVERETAPEQYLGALMSTTEGARIRSAEAKCHESAQVSADDWAGRGDALISLFELRIGADQIEPSDTAREKLRVAVFDDLTANQEAEIFQRLDTSKIIKYLSAVPSDYITFEYLDRRDFIEFEKASPGQQASALLGLLLNQEAGPLIIDQPEDDLDNRKIMDIVKLIRKTKQKRQVLFATHNANIVVNGDADKIIALVPVPEGTEGIQATPRIAIDVDGAIETPGMRDSITHTMEGGREAFELRSRKYAFER